MWRQQIERKKIMEKEHLTHNFSLDMKDFLL